MTLRSTILVTTIGILVLTVTAVVWVTQKRWTESTQTLFREVLDKASLEIRQHVRTLLEMGEREGEQVAAYAKRRLESSMTRSEALNDLVPLLVDVVRSQPDLTYASVGLQDTGDYVHAHRASDGRIETQMSRLRSDGRYDRLDREANGGASVRAIWDYDPRKRPYFELAKSANQPVWTETYRFVDLVKGRAQEQTQGVTHAVPVYGDRGRLLGVVSIDVSLASLGRFLPRVRVSKTGFAILVEAVQGKAPTLLAGDRGENWNAQVLDAIMRLPDQSKSYPLDINIAGGRFLGLVSRVRSKDPPWVLGAFIPERELLGPIEASIRQTLLLIAMGLVVAMLASILVSALVSRPIRNIVARAERIRALRIQTELGNDSRIQEVRQLDDAFARLESTMSSFTQFVPKDVVQSLLASGKKAEPQGELRNITVLFADVAGFTTLASQESPDTAVKLLSRFFEIMTEAVEASGGMIDKFIGDEVMAVWGALTDRPDHALSACRAALQAHAKIVEEGDLTVRMGIHTGEAVVGIIGTPARLNFTSIGDAVNLAKRIEGLNKAMGTRILISGATFELAQDKLDVRDKGEAAVAGLSKPVQVYELVGLV